MNALFFLLGEIIYVSSSSAYSIPFSYSYFCLKFFNDEDMSLSALFLVSFVAYTLLFSKDMALPFFPILKIVSIKIQYWKSKVHFEVSAVYHP